MGLREADTLARMGGDEFLVILEQIKGPDQVVEVIRKIQHSLSEPFQVNGRSVGISVSIGASLFPSQAHEAAGMLEKVDQSLLQAKSLAFG